MYLMRLMYHYVDMWSSGVLLKKMDTITQSLEPQWFAVVLVFKVWFVCLFAYIKYKYTIYLFLLSIIYIIYIHLIHF